MKFPSKGSSLSKNSPATGNIGTAETSPDGLGCVAGVAQPPLRIRNRVAIADCHFEYVLAVANGQLFATQQNRIDSEIPSISAK